MRFQRLLQIPLFFLFLFLLWLAAYPLPAWFEVDLFLRLDPLISLGSMAVAREFIPKAAWAFVVLGLALLLGRVFCGYICPMGATIDFWDWANRKRGKSKGENSFEGAGRFRGLKYLVLIALAGSALVGYLVDLSFFAPVSHDAVLLLCFVSHRFDDRESLPRSFAAAFPSRGSRRPFLCALFRPPVQHEPLCGFSGSEHPAARHDPAAVLVPKPVPCRRDFRLVLLQTSFSKGGFGKMHELRPMRTCLPHGRHS